MTDHAPRKPKISPIQAGYAAVFIVSILIAAKAYAYFLSGSVTVLSSLIDSVMDSVISIMALGSIYYARRPPDEDHRWGHGKMEAVSALFQAAIIAGGGAFLVFESIKRLVKHETVFAHDLAIYVMVLAIVLSVILVAIQRLSLHETDSLAIEADSAHYGADILINIGAIAVLAFGMLGAPLWIDPLFALGVAGFMGYVARGIAGKAVNMLMDREISEEDRAQIIDVITTHDKVLGWHDLRTHRSGPTYVISFDIEADPDLSLWAAHAIAKDLEEGILKIFPNSDIIIHVDPEGFIEDARHRVKGVHH